MGAIAHASVKAAYRAAKGVRCSAPSFGHRRLVGGTRVLHWQVHLRRLTFRSIRSPRCRQNKRCLALH